MRYTVVIASPAQRAIRSIANFIGEMNENAALIARQSNEQFVAFCSRETACIIDNSRSRLVIGTVFKADRRVSNDSADPLGDWNAERLVSEVWGGYIALASRPNGVEVVRDPSGAVPCYYFRLDEAVIITSEPGLATAAAAINPTIDWAIVLQAMVYRDLRPTRTALKGIEELHPGMAAIIARGEIISRCVWSPWTFTSRAHEIGTEVEAIRLVGESVRRCVTGWGERFSPSLCEVSGGLDSAIVAAVLSGSQVAPAALSFGAAPGDPDETPYARAIAATLNLPLTVLDLDINRIDLARSAARCLPRPCARAFAQAIDIPRLAHAQAIGAEAIFSGGGGDNVFCNLQSALPVVDHLHRKGPRLAVLATVANVAAVTQTNVWEVLAHALRRTLRPRPNDHWTVRSHYIAKERLDGLAAPEGHPWIVAPDGTRPGKRAHVMALIGVQNHLEARSSTDALPIVSPLLSQPVMEACLKVPTWFWYSRAQNRSVARDAFRAGLPAAVMDRTSKGAFDGFCASIIDRNRTIIREMLLDGLLAREGLLDIAEIERDLRGLSVNGESGARLLALVDIEAWARTWERGAD